MKLAVIGLGAFNASLHAPALVSYGRETGNLEMVLCEPDQARAAAWRAKFGGGAWFRNLDELLAAGKPSAAYVTVPPAVTCGVVEHLLQLGIPTFTEKPPGLTPVETTRLIVAAGTTLHAVGFNRRFSPVLTRMKHIAEDTIGNTPLAASCEFTRVDRYDLDFATTLIHGLDALRFLAGDFERVNMCRPSVQTTPPSFCAEISGTLANGATVRLNAAAAVGDARERYALFGRGVTLEAAVAMPGLPETGSVRLWRDGALCLDLNERAMGIHGAPDCLRSGILPQARQFLDAVASGHGPAGITFTESLQSVELADFARGNGGVWFAFDGTRPDAL